jgi:hypothetical protein
MAEEDLGRRDERERHVALLVRSRVHGRELVGGPGDLLKRLDLTAPAGVVLGLLVRLDGVLVLVDLVEREARRVVVVLEDVEPWAGRAR